MNTHAHTENTQTVEQASPRLNCGAREALQWPGTACGHACACGRACRRAGEQQHHDCLGCAGCGEVVHMLCCQTYFSGSACLVDWQSVRLALRRAGHCTQRISSIDKFKGPCVQHRPTQDGPMGLCDVAVPIWRAAQYIEGLQKRNQSANRVHRRL